MSQPFVEVRVLDVGRPCRLRGFPRLSGARVRSGFPGSTHGRTRSTDLSVHHGIYEQRSRRAGRVVISARSPAGFLVGTATAYQGGRHVLTVRRVEAHLPGVVGSRRVRLDEAATRPSGRPLPVGVTPVEACGRAEPRHRNGFAISCE